MTRIDFVIRLLKAGDTAGALHMLERWRDEADAIQYVDLPGEHEMATQAAEKLKRRQ